jgi:CheY-like chemotaxis protein
VTSADILIVDDTSFNIEVLQMMLRSTFKIKSDYVFSGEEAISRVKNRYYAGLS